MPARTQRRNGVGLEDLGRHSNDAEYSMASMSPLIFEFGRTVSSQGTSP